LSKPEGRFFQIVCVSQKGLRPFSDFPFFARFESKMIKSENGLPLKVYSRVSNIESNNSQNVGLEDYNNISDGIFPHFTTPSIKISLG